MKTIKLLVTGLAVIISMNGFAQDTKSTQSPSARGLSLSVGPEFILPIGTFKDAGYQFGVGGSAKLVLPLATMLDGTISAGYVVFGKSKLDELNNIGSYTFIPFKAGVRVRTNSGFYVEPQAGYTQTKFQKVSEGEGQFTYALNLGYLINNMVDVSARYEAVSTTGVSAKMLGLRLAYNFNFARSK